MATAPSTTRKAPAAKATGSHATGNRTALAAAKAKIAAKATPAERPEAPKASDALLNGVRSTDHPAAPAPRRANRTSRAAAKATPAATAPKATPARAPKASPKPAPAPKPEPEPSGVATKSEAKAELFKIVLEGIESALGAIPDDSMVFDQFDLEEAAQLVANAVHHFPVGKDGDGRRWWTEGTLPRPDRSEWR